MATEQELAQAAMNHAKKTSWPWDKYLAEIRSNKDYAYKSTEWYKAGSDLEQGKHATPAPIPPPTGLDMARARIFLAQDPLDALQAPEYMVPVCTADLGYRQYYTADVIRQLQDKFDYVEAWCDCRNPTAYSVAQEMVISLGLDGPAWGQCENQEEWNHAYSNGARRMVGNISALNPSSKEKVGSAEVLLSVELYRNVQPWMVPDWQGLNAGVGGNCIACYASEGEGAVYTPVSEYKSLGYYVSGRDSVYGVGLKAADWAAL